MILLNKWTRLFHFARPALSSLTNRVALEGILQERLARAIKEVNNQTLQQYTIPEKIENKLIVENNQSQLISQRSVILSIVNPRTLEHREVEMRLDQQLTDLKLEPSQFGFGFGTPENDMKHFSKKRGAPAVEELQEYSLNDRQLLIFNLPSKINKQDIRVVLKQEVTKVEIKYCALGFPAYAKVEFIDKQNLDKSLEKFSNKQIQFGQRIAFIKTQEDHDKLLLANRRLVVNLEQNDDFQETIIEMSRFGRVMHLDWPIEVSVNPSVQDVREFYKNSRDLVKINMYLPDGTVESEYYPEVRVWKANEDERQQQNIIERAQRLREAYDNRARFAKQIPVWVGKEHQLSFKHKGYCVVTFSTSEECQNYYFTHGARTKMSLVGKRQEFQYDPFFRKQVLRVIDNEKLVSDKNHKGKEKQKTQLDEFIQQKVDPYTMSEEKIQKRIANESYNLFNRLLVKYYFDDGLKVTEGQKVFFQMSDQNSFWEWQNDLRLMRTNKADQKTLTFDQLAEIELYGRVLPKDEKIERLKIEESKYRVSREEELVKEYNLLTNLRDISYRDKMYERQRERNNRLADQALGITRQVQNQQSGQYEQDQSQGHESDGQNIGKHHFSTYRPQTIYRKRTAEEEATYNRRYSQFIRGLIYEYMGVFHDKDIEEVATSNLQAINPQSLTFLNGDPFLTEEQITNVLQFRRDFYTAQNDYEDFVYGNEYVKSSGINLKEIFSNFKQFEASNLQQLAEVGVVQEVRKVSQTGEQLQEKVDILNTQYAEFGEQYKEQIIDEEIYLTKIRKLEHLMPLDRIAHLEGVVQNFDELIEQHQAQVFQAHYEQMKETGIVSDAVCEAFGVQKGLSVDQLMIQMGKLYKVTRKDLDMLDRIKTYSSEALKADIKQQRRLARSRGKKVGSYDYAKDPSEIYVKDREGYYKVSRFRQV